MNERNLYEALNRLRNDPTLSSIKEWLLELREESRNRLETQSDGLQVEQGRAAAYKKILDAIETSPGILSKIVK